MQPAIDDTVLSNKAQIALLEHPRPTDPDKVEYVVNSPLSACLMTGYIASLLKANSMDVEIIDANLSKWSIAETIDHLKNRSFKLIGVRLVYLWDKTDEILHMLKELRKCGIKAHINLYGHYPTFSYEAILKRYTFINSITLGEPENTFLELAKEVVNGELNGKLLPIKGLVNWSRPGEIVSRKPIENLDDVPFPTRTNIELEKKSGISTYILGSRGCYNNCGFCYLNAFYGDGSTWRGRSIENIFEEVRELYVKFGCKDFYFSDASFFGNGKNGKNRAKELANTIIEHGLKISFGIECRANDIDEETVYLLVQAGLKNIFLGIESGDQQSLRSFRKNITVDINKKAIRCVRKCGLEPSIGFIMFGKNANITSIRESFEFLKEMKLFTNPYTTAHLLFHKQSIFQGTADYNDTLNNQNRENKGLDILSEPDNYELLFDYKDKRVSAFADITESFCSTALKTIANINNAEHGTINSCSNKENGSIRNSFLDKLNALLIDLFEQTLISIETNCLDLDDKSVSLLKEEHKNEIKHLLHNYLSSKSSLQGSAL